MERENEQSHQPATTDNELKALEASIQNELNGLDENQIRERYIEAMVRHNVNIRKIQSGKGKDISQQERDEAEQMATTLQMLVPSEIINDLTIKEINRRTDEEAVK